MKPWLQFSLIRVGMFVVVFGVLYFLRPDLWWAWAIGAAVISLLVSYIFFGSLRARVADGLAARRAGGPAVTVDEEAEDR